MTASVLHVAQPAEGGVPQVALRHARAQVEAGWRVALACPRRISSPATDLPEGVDHVPWDSARLPDRALPAEVRRLARLVERVQPDVVHLHSTKAGLVGRLAVRGRRPTVFQPHAWSFHAVSGGLRRATTAWERVAARWTDRVLCVSEDERQEGERAGVGARYRVVPNGVDLRRFPPAGERDRQAARYALGLPPGPLAVCVGRLAPQKGQDVLLAAWAAVQAAVPEARLALVGDGPLRERLAAQAPAGVHLAGSSDDVRSWYAAADVVVAPSRWEGMALVPLEALATGRSVVASAVAGMRESVPDGAGALVPPDDPAALAAALVPRLQARALADAEGQAGRRVVEASHDVRAVTAAVMDVYAEVVRDRRG